MGLDAEREPEMEPGEWAPPPPPMSVNTCDSQSLELTWEGEHWYNAGNAAPAVQCTGEWHPPPSRGTDNNSSGETAGGGTVTAAAAAAGLRFATAV
jgi:hypothetical protein